MKKIITLIIAFFIIQLSVSAQTTFELYDANNQLVSSGSEFIVPAELNVLTKYKVKIKNTTNNPISIIISKNTESMAEGAIGTICTPDTESSFGTCYTSDVTNPFVLVAGETSGFAELDIRHPNAGSSVINYRIYNSENENDFASIKVTFTTGLSGVNNNNINNFAIFPNPANSNFTINYDFNSKSYVEIYDVLGKVVTRINPGSGSNISVDCSKWEKGYYFCRLFNNGKIEKTVKLVVTR